MVMFPESPLLDILSETSEVQGLSLEYINSSPQPVPGRREGGGGGGGGLGQKSVDSGELK